MLIKILSWVAPGVKPVADWCNEYMKLLDLRDLPPKTKNKKKTHIRHLQDAICTLRIRAVPPTHIAELVHRIWNSGRQNTARKILLEAKDLFSEAVAADLITTNPAVAIKPLPVKIRRQRMRLEDWRALYEEAIKSEPPWMSIMLLVALVTGQRRADLQKWRSQISGIGTYTSSNKKPVNVLPCRSSSN